MNEIGYAAFSGHMHRSALARQVPLNVTIEVTHRCPLVCVHCYNNLAVNDREAARAELTSDEHRRILSELRDAGSLWLLYTGGEIFARADFLDIYKDARQKGFLVTLFTNGTQITPRVADVLAEYRPFAVEITLYGRTRETYEGLTGTAGSYGRCLRAIDLLRERGLPVKLKTVAITANRHEVWAMQQFAADLGVEFKFDSMMNPRIDCSRSPLEVRLSPEDIVGLDVQDEKRMGEWQVFAERFFRPANPPERHDDLYHCGGGMTSFSIDPYGAMSICVLSQVDKYDLRAGSVNDGWSRFLHSVRRKTATRPTKCTDCELKSMCGMCPATAELENGDAEAPVDFLCQVAHLRAHAFGLPVAAHGPCEYCPGGHAHSAMMDAAGRLRALTPGVKIPVTRHRLPVLAQAATACGSGGCSACGAGG